jgi:hypothetical protein
MVALNLCELVNPDLILELEPPLPIELLICEVMLHPREVLKLEAKLI